MKNLKNENVVWGVLFIFFGVGFFLSSIGILNFGSFISKWWPVALLIVSIIQFLTSRWRSAMVWAVLGLTLLLSTSGLVNVGFWSMFWPMILIIVGLSFITDAFVYKGGDLHDHVNIFAVFGGADKIAESKKFVGANIISIFGGSKLDLRNAKLSEKGASVNVFVLFGGTEIMVPKDIQVKSDIFALFGGSDDKRKDIVVKGDKSGLVVQGIVLFGGAEIKN